MKNSTKSGKGSWQVYRSAITGRFVTKAYASRHSATTLKETIRRRSAC